MLCGGKAIIWTWISESSIRQLRDFKMEIAELLKTQTVFRKSALSSPTHSFESEA